MSRNKKVLKNTIILSIIIFILFPHLGLYPTPLSAHKASEKSIHYGPSKVVHVEDIDREKYMLSKYDKWASCNTVNRRFFFFWSFGNQVTGFENDSSKAIDYTWSMSDGAYCKLYGIINDPRVKSIEISLINGDTFTTEEFYQDMFLFTWKTEDKNEREPIDFKKIKGYDKDNKLVFEDERPSY